MFKNSYIKLSVIIILLIFVIGFTISKLEIKKTVKANISNSLVNNGAKVGSEPQSAELNETSSQVYFSIFKFISDLVPTGSKN